MNKENKKEKDKPPNNPFRRLTPQESEFMNIFNRMFDSKKNIELKTEVVRHINFSVFSTFAEELKPFFSEISDMLKNLETKILIFGYSKDRKARKEFENIMINYLHGLQEKNELQTKAEIY